jgi:NAD-dependent DNA ligase
MNFKKMSLEERKKLYVKASHAYFNEKHEILTDSEFDALEKSISVDDPTWNQLRKTGVRTKDRKNEVHLNQFMPSLDKAYPDTLQATYLKRIPLSTVLVMDKLDGTSLQLRYQGKPTQLVTRGNGTIGRDVSRFIPKLVEYGIIPAELSTKDTIDLRLEGVMRKDIFEKRWSVEARGEKEGFDNARQLVNGIFLRNEPGIELKDIDLRVLGVYGMEMAEGLHFAEISKFDVVWWDQPDVPTDYPVERFFTDMLAHRKKRSPFVIDGLVITHDAFRLHYKNADKPKNIFAFKVNNDASAWQVRVVDVEYAKTRHGRISVVALITPTRMDGVVVERVTVHNAAWMMERNIGPGALIAVLRSGGVIPKIVDVIEPGRFKAPPFPYKLEGRYFVISATGHDRDVALRSIRFFFTTLGIELLAEKTIEKLYEEGYKSINDYIDIIRDRESQMEAKRVFMQAGIGDKQSSNMLGELIRVLKAPIKLKKLMVASGRFDAGIGERKLSSIEDAGIAMREICNMDTQQIEQRLAAVKGWSDKTIALMVAGVPRFRKWYKPLKSLLTVDGTLPEKATYLTGKLGGKRIAFTGYRDTDQMNKILANGGSIVSFGATTDVLLYHADGKASTKVEKAGDRAMLWEDFVQQYGIE